ncbi:MAG: hypothetical protein ACP5NS_04725 [Candidatus Pacearchaeota archaeon]
MDSKVFWFMAVFLILVIGVFTYLNSAQSEPENLSLSSSLCESVFYSGDDRIDLLFISTKEEAQEYSDLLFDTEPFKEYESYFNVRVIEGLDPACESYKGIAILCNTKEVQEIAKSCEHDYIFVVKDEPAQIRSSSYRNVVSLNSNVEKSVINHEIGHALANFAEEYYTSASVPRGSKNCQSSCDKFGGLADSCSQECSESNLYRSTKSGVMRTLITTNYGPYNVALLKTIFEKNKPSDSAITGNQIQEDNLCNDALVEIQITQTEDSIAAQSTNKESTGCAPDKAGEGETCINGLCYNLVDVFTDTQEVGAETLSGEVLEAPEQTSVFVTTDNEEVIITHNNEQIAIINTLQAGATACLI